MSVLPVSSLPQIKGPPPPSMALLGSVHFILTRGGSCCPPTCPMNVPKSQHPTLEPLTVTFQQCGHWEGREGQLGALFILLQT